MSAAKKGLYLYCMKTEMGVMEDEVGNLERHYTLVVLLVQVSRRVKNLHVRSSSPVYFCYRLEPSGTCDFIAALW